MNKDFQLSIPSRCQEKWNNFIPTQNGGFCTSCRKEVVDFTSWSEDQIKAYFKDGRANTCGRFRENQLKTYTLNNVSWRNRLFPMSILGIALLFTTPVEASKKTRPPIELHDRRETPARSALSSTDTSGTRIVTGIVRSYHDGSYLPGVNVVLKGTALGTSTDADGKFTLEIPFSKNSPVLQFSFVGLRTVDKILVTENNEISIDMETDILPLGDVVLVRRWSPRGIWIRIKNIFR